MSIHDLIAGALFALVWDPSIPELVKASDWVLLAEFTELDSTKLYRAVEYPLRKAKIRVKCVIWSDKPGAAPRSNEFSLFVSAESPEFADPIFGLEYLVYLSTGGGEYLPALTSLRSFVGPEQGRWPEHLSYWRAESGRRQSCLSAVTGMKPGD